MKRLSPPLCAVMLLAAPLLAAKPAHAQLAQVQPLPPMQTLMQIPAQPQPQPSAQTAASAPGQPQTLTEPLIRAFYQQEVDAYKWSRPRFHTFLGDALTQNYLGDSTVTITFPNHAPQTQGNTQNKTSTVDHADAEYDMMQNARISLVVSAVHPSADGTTATVDYKTTARNISLSEPGSNRQMSADSVSDCTDTLVAGGPRGLQVKASRCHTTLNFITGITSGFGR